MSRVATNPAIRDAGEQDVALLLDPCPLLEFGPAAELSLAMAKSSFPRHAACPNCQIYIAVLGDAPAETFVLLIVDTIAHAGRPLGIAEDVAVGSAARRYGVGQQMMAYAKERCKEARCYKTALSSHPEQPEAHASYESLRFARHSLSFLVT